jgi:hypothetical protein
MLGGYSIIQVIIFLVIVIAIIGVLYVVMQATGVKLPPWVIQIGWIVLVAFVAILAIKLLWGMM